MIIVLPLEFDILSSMQIYQTSIDVSASFRLQTLSYRSAKQTWEMKVKSRAN